jgi:hypothetical protein
VSAEGVGRRLGKQNRQRQSVVWDSQRTNVVTLKMTERSGNVYEKKGLGARDSGLGAEEQVSGVRCQVRGLGHRGKNAARACQHHPHDLACGSRRPTNLEKELLLLTERSGNVFENKGSDFETWERSGNVVENKGVIRYLRECH